VVGIAIITLLAGIFVAAAIPMYPVSPKAVGNMISL